MIARGIQFDKVSRSNFAHATWYAQKLLLEEFIWSCWWIRFCYMEIAAVIYRKECLQADLARQCQIRNQEMVCSLVYSFVLYFIFCMPVIWPIQWQQCFECEMKKTKYWKCFCLYLQMNSVRYVLILEIECSLCQ